MKQPKITKKVTDMSIYGVVGDCRWCGDVIVESEQGVSVHGKYFPTRRQARAYVDRIYKQIVSISNA